MLIRMNPYGAHTLARTHTHTHARMHALKDTYARTHVATHARTHALTQAQSRTHTRACARAHTHTHIHTHAHAHTHTHTHTHTYFDTPPPHLQKVVKVPSQEYATMAYLLTTHGREHMAINRKKMVYVLVAHGREYMVIMFCLRASVWTVSLYQWGPVSCRL